MKKSESEEKPSHRPAGRKNIALVCLKLLAPMTFAQCHPDLSDTFAPHTQAKIWGKLHFFPYHSFPDAHLPANA